MSGDIHAFKCEDMERRARTLGIQILQTGVRDAEPPVRENGGSRLTG